MHFVLDVIVTLLLGVAGITETSSQTAYPGPVEDTRWSEKSSGVAKVRCFFVFCFLKLVATIPNKYHSDYPVSLNKSLGSYFK